MGIYINPPQESKEQFLSKYGIKIREFDFKVFDFSDKTILPVCLVNNGPFTAAGVAYCPRQVEAFLYPDHRPRTFFMVKMVDLLDEEKSGIRNLISLIGE